MRTIEIISGEYNKKVPCYTHAHGVLQHHSIYIIIKKERKYSQLFFLSLQRVTFPLNYSPCRAYSDLLQSGRFGI
jgi:hypothetical protein